MAQVERDPVGISRVERAQVVIPCDELAPTLEFFTGRLGMVVDTIFPADSPRVAVVSGHGITLRLEEGAPGAPGVIRLEVAGDPGGEDRRELTAPNGTVVRMESAGSTVVVPEGVQELVVTHLADAEWGLGRAGMRYRDLIPGRLGGRFVASHISIPEGGPVPDYVHYHHIRFQMIYCHRGWVRVAYEDQGEPMVLRSGDCFLQPPGIRHRVLESSPGLEVIEIGCPAVHDTHADHEMVLPTGRVLPERDFGGQRFVHHVAAEAEWRPWRHSGFAYRDTGIAAATDGLAGVGVARPTGAESTETTRHSAEFMFGFVLGGSAVLTVEGHPEESLATGDSFVIPAGPAYSLGDCSPDLEILDVTLPASPPIRA